jgi:uncharacterized protein YjbI with pentapeptide repeats
MSHISIHGKTEENVMKIEIRSRLTCDVLFSFECENNTIKLTIQAAIRAGANLRDADLRDADLYSADLYSADLRGANLRYADLRDADLHGANLRDANLRDADLRGANLRDANLRDADLRGANLYSANLRGVDLRGANLHYADLYGADDEKIKCDGKFHHIVNIGSERGTLEMYSCGEYGWLIKRGCFTGSKDEFLAAVNKKHGNNEHSKKYHAIVEALCN